MVEPIIADTRCGTTTSDLLRALEETSAKLDAIGCKLDAIERSFAEIKAAIRAAGEEVARQMAAPPSASRLAERLSPE